MIILDIIYIFFVLTLFLLITINFINNKITFFLFYKILAFFYIYIGISFNIILKRIQLPNELFISLLLSLILSNIFLLIEGISYRKRKYKYQKILIKRLNKIISILMLVSFISYILYFSINGIPLFSDNVEVQRVIAFNNSKLLFYNILILSPFLIIYNLLYNNTKNTKIFITFYFIASLFTGFRSLLMSLIVILFLTYQVKYHFIRRNNFFKYIKYIALGVIFLIFITYLRLPSDNKNLTASYNRLTYRIFYNNIDNLNNIHNYFDTHPKLFGKTILWDFPYLRYVMNIINSNFQDETFAIWMTRQLNPNFNSHFIMTPTIMGIFLANFGLLGIIFVETFIFVISISLEKFKYNLYFYPVYIYMIYIAFAIFTRGFFSVLGLFIIPVVFIYSISIIVSKLNIKQLK